VGADGRDLRNACLLALSGAAVDPDAAAFIFERRRWQSGRVMLCSVKTGRPIAPRFDIMMHARASRMLMKDIQAVKARPRPVSGQTIRFKYDSGGSDWSGKKSHMSTLAYSANNSYTVDKVEEGSEGRYFFTITQYSTLWAPFAATEQFLEGSRPLCAACQRMMSEEKLLSISFCEHCAVSLSCKPPSS
jgi:hypothetical protein